MPYDVIICDDEPYIADATAALLRMQGQWEVNIAHFYASRQALERIEARRVDILIVDIRMPGMSGLDIMRRTAALWPAAQIILLTAHPEFDYVYDAIQHDHVAYVLKSEGHTALLRAVQHAIEALDKSIQTRRFVETAQSQLAEALPLLRRELLLDIIHGATFSDEQLARFDERLRLPLDLQKPLSMWTVLAESYDKEDTFIERDDRLRTITSAMRHYLPEDIRLLSFSLDNQRSLFLAQTAEAAALPESQLEGMLEAVQQACSEQLHLPFSAAYATQACAPEGIKTTYETLKALQLSMVSTGNAQWLAAAGTAPAQRNGRPLMDGQYPEKARLFRHAFENGDPSALSQLDALLLPIEQADGMDNPETLEMYMHVSIQVANLLRSGQASPYIDTGASLRHLLLFRDHERPQDAAKYVRDIVHILEQARTEHASSSMHTIVSMVTAYITAHLDGDVSLITLADVAGVNASYLSRLFRRVTGETLSSYITSAKMHEAYRLLQGAARMQEISQALGFPTPAYFSFFFKKNAGMTPSEYRSRWHARE